MRDFKLIRMLFLILFINLIVITGCGVSTQKNILGIIENPKIPNIEKPSDLFYCEKDEDCVIDEYLEDSCCLGCGRVINVESKLYGEKWRELNCQDSSTYMDCIVFECCVPKNIRCENSKCIADVNC